MNDDDVREGLNFHYKADISIKNDKLHLFKMSNKDKG